jgi:hypothetical protein
MIDHNGLQGTEHRWRELASALAEARPCITGAMCGTPRLPGTEVQQGRRGGLGGLIFNRAPALPRHSACVFRVPRPKPRRGGGCGVRHLGTRARPCHCQQNPLRLSLLRSEELGLHWALLLFERKLRLKHFGGPNVHYELKTQSL